ncbi:MAG: thermonuclease family protein [Roseomonas sp.]|nr:thermonuclease family protein [Roseomonas sp.]
MKSGPQRYTDCRVVDGDTLACRQGRVRLRGVDTPERGESGYRAAQQELRRRTPGRTVTVVPHHRDRHGRIVGDVYSRGQNVGRSMNADGYSKPRGARR